MKMHLESGEAFDMQACENFPSCNKLFERIKKSSICNKLNEYYYIIYYVLYIIYYNICYFSSANKCGRQYITQMDTYYTHIVAQQTEKPELLEIQNKKKISFTFYLFISNMLTIIK